jgi:hypothetical protein
VIDPVSECYRVSCRVLGYIRLCAKATVYTQVGFSLNTLHHPPQSPLIKGGRIWTGSLPFIRGGLGWGNAECSNLDSSVVSDLCVRLSPREREQNLVPLLPREKGLGDEGV